MFVAQSAVSILQMIEAYKFKPHYRYAVGRVGFRGFGLRADQNKGCSYGI